MIETVSGAVTTPEGLVEGRQGDLNVGQQRQHMHDDAAESNKWSSGGESGQEVNRLSEIFLLLT